MAKKAYFGITIRVVIRVDATILQHHLCYYCFIKGKQRRKKMTTLFIAVVIGIIGGCVMASLTTDSKYLAQ